MTLEDTRHFRARQRDRRRAGPGVAVVVGLLLFAIASSPTGADAVTSVLTGVHVERDVHASLSVPEPGRPRHVLIVGTDRRPLGAGPGGPSITGAFADVVVLLTSSSGTASAVSLPRSLRVVTPRFGPLKLSQSLSAGRRELLAAVHSLTGLPLHGYIELDPAGLVATVDEVGGVHLVVDEPVRDRTSGLDLGRGRQRLDGERALAWVRSRSAERLVDGAWRSDLDGDLGRVARQQRLMAALRSELPTDPLALVRLARAMGPHVTVDSPSTALRALAALRRAELGTLPTAPTLPIPLTLSPFFPAHHGALPSLKASAEGRRWLRQLAVGPLPATTVGGRP